MNEKFTIGIIVSNHFGVLNRVAGLYAKRGYNIDSLAVGETDNPHFSRMTIVSTGDEYMKEQVISQLRKLHDVKIVELLDKDNSATVEHMLIKIKANGNTANVSELINSYSGKVLDFGNDYILAEITGGYGKIDEFIGEADEYGILETCRSGLISMVRGTDNMLSVEKLEKNNKK